MVAVDVVADEVLASEIMRMPALASLGNMTPNLRFIQRDKAHGGRRIMKRPWRADAYLHDVMKRMIINRTSPAQIIQHNIEMRGEGGGNGRKPTHLRCDIEVVLN